ncbi:hypothetical protein PAUR_a1521 [Pseudoalteromonas aurantia 208]|uniref:Uncharacterized protein n=1 Tax=Pseudoalteromonas aurantia 208 TaxID=1314867 RepID=A0ABR9EAL8_9GAMM|nr:hypothetical protein [Pseudoalteromonas aurantia 208]
MSRGSSSTAVFQEVNLSSQRLDNYSGVEVDSEIRMSFLKWLNYTVDKNEE